MKFDLEEISLASAILTVVLGAVAAILDRTKKPWAKALVLPSITVGLFVGILGGLAGFLLGKESDGKIATASHDASVASVTASNANVAAAIARSQAASAERDAERLRAGNLTLERRLFQVRAFLGGRTVSLKLAAHLQAALRGKLRHLTIQWPFGDTEAANYSALLADAIRPAGVFVSQQASRTPIENEEQTENDFVIYGQGVDWMPGGGAKVLATVLGAEHFFTEPGDSFPPGAGPSDVVLFVNHRPPASARELGRVEAGQR